MKSHAFVLAAALCCAAATAAAQSFAPALTGLPSTLGQPASHYSTRHLAGGGSVTYFEAQPSHEAQHEQFAQLRQAFATTKPTLVLYQWLHNDLDSTETATIARLGVSGYVSFLAQQQQVPGRRFADCVAEYEYLQARTEAAPLKLYYLLREVQRWRARTGATKAGTRLAMQYFIDHSAYFLPGTEQAIRTLPELETAYRQYGPPGTKWWELPARYFQPDAPASQTGPVLAALNQTLGEYRTQLLQRLATAPAQTGQRILVVTEPGYLPAALGQASRISRR